MSTCYVRPLLPLSLFRAHVRFSRQNRRFDMVVMFGGYSPSLPFYIEGSEACYGYSYFADTFALDLTGVSSLDGKSASWKQIIAPSFPTYRAQATLLADADTGRMYLFGGYTNTDWVPAGNHEVTRSYGDVWELRVDLPGGHFYEVDPEDERRTALAGPWQTCFTCGSLGLWKKCGGAYRCDCVSNVVLTTACRDM